MSKALHHLTLDTGHLAVTARADVRDDVIDALVPLIDREQGPIPATGLYVDLIRPIDPARRRPIPGAAAFTLTIGTEAGGQAVAACIVCWDENQAADAWDMATAGDELVSQLGRPIDRPPLPWVAVRLLPGIATLERRSIAMLGDLERCLAWALIETPV